MRNGESHSDFLDASRDRHKPTFGANSYGKKRRSQTAALEQRP
jgi:hypothetical protein